MHDYFKEMHFRTLEKTVQYSLVLIVFFDIFKITDFYW